MQCFGAFFYVFGVAEFLEEFVQADQPRNKDVRVNMLKVLSFYFQHLYDTKSQELSVYLRMVGKWVRLFQEDKDSQVRDLASNFAAGVIEICPEESKEFRKLILEEKLKISPTIKGSLHE